MRTRSASARVTQALTDSSSLNKLLRRCIPFWAVAAADVINLCIMRGDEMLHGVAVYTEDGIFLGKSREAGRRAVAQSIIGRVTAAFPILVLPPILVHKFEKTMLYRRNPWTSHCLLAGLIAAGIQMFVPLCFATWGFFCTFCCCCFNSVSSIARKAHSSSSFIMLLLLLF